MDEQINKLLRVSKNNLHLGIPIFGYMFLVNLLIFVLEVFFSVFVSRPYQLSETLKSSLTCHHKIF
jgi:hypothetical protein